ncbi:(-)-germacrene D synthase-like, partial [Phalaenopsis equestris]|uniref:(-)-germacrene D synthase-like n=1 Tax=Phalaenopsis equestris TaxID=78828 RepID=UPI0009E534F6
MDTARQSADFHKIHQSVWGDYFINYSPLQSSLTKKQACQKQKNEKLRVEIRKILLDTIDPLQSLELIDSIERFGVAYHFQKEINDILCRVHKRNIGDDDDDLYAVALRFRLLRQHKYQITSDVFIKFLDDKGEFKAHLCNDVRALLSLYEAAYLGFPDEEILDKAKNFSRVHLKSSIYNVEPSLALMVSSALDLPLVRRTDRLKARSYFEIYENYNLCNKNLTEFAKFDFNLLQTIHQEEVRIISVWWKELCLPKYLPFARDRVVETYFWMLAAYSEPCNSHARVINAKITPLIVAIDDIYDIYGTPEELELFTNIIECWDLERVSMLPEYMQRCFLALHDTLKEIEDELAPQHKCFRVYYLKEE